VSGACAIALVLCGAPSAAEIHIRVVDLIPKTLAGEASQNSEPFLTVDPSDASRMVASAFLTNPAGPTQPRAPLFISEDSGSTWWLNQIVASQGSTADITAGFRDDGRLLASILKLPGYLLLAHLDAEKYRAADPMIERFARKSSDQPFVHARGRIVYVGFNDLSMIGSTGQTASVDSSLDGGVTFVTTRLESRSTSGQNAPSVRLTSAKDGTVYAAFLGWRKLLSGRGENIKAFQGDVVVTRHDPHDGPVSFKDLCDRVDGLPGVRVATDRVFPWNPGHALGAERVGGSLSIAVHPADSSRLAIAWGDRVGADTVTLHVRTSGDKGQTWSDDVRVVTNALNPSLAIAEDGTIGFLYQKYIRGSGTAFWETHLERSSDGLVSSSDLVLARTPDGPYLPLLPYIGDYAQLLVVGNEFRGVFSANNTPDTANFPAGVTFQRPVNMTRRQIVDGNGFPVAASVDPFYFAVPIKW
jgi:hypothetical protein